MCPVCRGRGEVAAMVSQGFRGRPDTTGEPIGYAVNPNAWDPKIKDVWLVETNPFGKLFGIAICMVCHGTGFVK